MRIKLDKRYVDRFLNSPETGTGYTHAYVILRDGTKIEAVVSNCQFLDVSGVTNPADIKDITLRTGRV